MSTESRIYRALFDPAPGQQVTTGYRLDDGGSFFTPFTVTINDSTLGRLVALVDGEPDPGVVLATMGSPEDRLPVPKMQSAAPVPPVPPDVIAARVEEAELERLADEASGEAAARREERDEARRAKAAELEKLAAQGGPMFDKDDLVEMLEDEDTTFEEGEAALTSLMQQLMGAEARASVALDGDTQSFEEAA